MEGKNVQAAILRFECVSVGMRLRYEMTPNGWGLCACIEREANAPKVASRDAHTSQISGVRECREQLAAVWTTRMSAF